MYVNKKRIYLLLLAVLAGAKMVAATPFQAYDNQAQLEDLSAAGSPLRATGLGSFHVDISTSRKSVTCSLEGNVTNVSAKIVVAFQATLDLGSDRLGCEHHDYFVDYVFNPMMLSPGLKYDLNRKGRPIEWMGDVSPTVGKATVEFRVIFVQFADGSTFGTSQWSEELPSQRTARIELMKSLLKQFDDGGSPALTKTIADRLAKPANPQFLWDILVDMREKVDKDGAYAAADEIRERLKAVKERSNLIGQS
jgi:hypothetical protein